MTYRIGKKSRGRRTNKPDCETLARLYEDHTAEEIAEMYNVSANTVRHWIYLYRREDVESERGKEDV